jgi:hypothetical protein
MKHAETQVLEAYLMACKFRDQQTMKLARLRNPSAATHRKQTDLFKGLVDVFGESEGKRRWMQYLHALREDKSNAKELHDYWKTEAKRLNKVLKFLRSMK